MWHRIVKFFFALFLFPACTGTLVGFTQAVVKESGFFQAQWPFLVGFSLYALAACCLSTPLKAYVFGHELSHAVWVWIFKGKVKGFSVSEQGGKVETNKTNFLIALAPYFFPIYSILLILIYLLLRAFWDINSYFKILTFLLGFSWGFHLFMNLYALIKDQQEVRETGVFFSLVLIVILNTLVLGTLFVFTSPELTLESYISITIQMIKSHYYRFFIFI